MLQYRKSPSPCNLLDAGLSRGVRVKNVDQEEKQLSLDYKTENRSMIHRHMDSEVSSFKIWSHPLSMYTENAWQELSDIRSLVLVSN